MFNTKSKNSMFKSRKIKVVLIAMGLTTIGYLSIGLSSILAPAFTAYVGGLVALVTVYVGGNVTQKRLVGDIVEVKEEDNP